MRNSLDPRSGARPHLWITGASGFVGAWALAVAEARGWSVTGLGLPPEPGLAAQIGLARRCRWVELDLRDPAPVAMLAREERPALVLHLAAQALVPRARLQPLETAATNILGTLHLLEALRALSTPFGLLVATSDKVYAPGPAPHREVDPLGAAEPYAASKAATELLIGAWVQSWWPPQDIDAHGVAIATARAGNLLGGGDRAPDRLLPDALRAWGQGQPVGLRRPESTRPYLHVLDALSGYFQLLERLHPAAPAARRLQACGPWNFGGPERSAAELIEALAQAWPGAPGWRPTPTEGARVESARLSLDCSRARGELGWTPRGGLNPALAAARRWWTLLESRLSEDELWERMLEEVRLHPRLG